jgi:hypothetical protein
MFIQFIQGKIKDEQGLRSALDRWQSELMPGADGYLGTTAGVCNDGTFVALARFESEEAAKRNSDRPEQGAWWSEFESKLDGEVTFHDSADVETWLDGGSDDAGFVQVMTGHSSDVRRLRDRDADGIELLRKVRPEIIGGTFAIFDGDGYIQTAYFKSEGEARAMEGSEPPDEVKEMIAERQRLMGEVTYFDLHDPILVSAPG